MSGTLKVNFSKSKKNASKENAVRMSTPEAMQYDQAAETIPAKARQWPQQRTNHSAGPLHSGAIPQFLIEENHPNMPQSGLTEAEKVKAWTSAVLAKSAVMAELLQKPNTSVKAEKLRDIDKHTIGGAPSLFGRKAQQSRPAMRPGKAESANQDGEPLTPFPTNPAPRPTSTK